MAPGAITATTGDMKASLADLDALFWADYYKKYPRFRKSGGARDPLYRFLRCN
jgi:hypothetical protein